MISFTERQINEMTAKVAKEYWGDHWKKLRSGDKVLTRHKFKKAIRAALQSNAQKEGE